jgi:nitroreductase
MDVSKAIRSKRAVRKYTDDAVPDDVIRQILATARWSQSSKNTQPWEFYVITDKNLLAELSKAGDFATHLPSAAFAIALVGDNDSYIVGFDLGQAAMCLQLAAWELGIGSCLISFHRAEQASTILGVPEGRFVRIGLSFGYPSAEHKPAKMGGRESLDEIVHWNKW